MKYLQINNQLFIKNRQLFKSRVSSNTLAIFNSNDVMPTNADGTMLFRQNNDLFWLSGVDQEESVLLIYPDNEGEKEILFLKETNKHIAIWEGAKLDKKEALKVSGIRTVYWLSEMGNKLEELINKSDGVYLNKNIHSRSDCNHLDNTHPDFNNLIGYRFYVLLTQILNSHYLLEF